MDKEKAQKCAEVLTVEGHDYAGSVLARMFEVITEEEACDVFDHIGRFIEKKWGGEWPDPPDCVRYTDGEVDNGE